MKTLEINLASSEWAQALSSRYKYMFIKGGRMSGKSHEVATYLTERSLEDSALKIVCLREVQKSIKHSSKAIIDEKINSCGARDLYKSIEKEIRRVDGSGLFFFEGMNDLTADNIKSLEGFSVGWFEEAQNLSFKSLKTLRPTIMRLQGAQLVFTWNPKFPDDPIEKFAAEMRGEPDCLHIHVNYDKNKFLTRESKEEIDRDQRKFPEDFPHVYLGQFDTSFHGHFYAQLVAQAEEEGRITAVPRKAGVDIITAWDLGKTEATAIWVGQMVGREPRILHYMHDNFQDLDRYADWIKEHGYQNATHYLPHDSTHDRLGMKGSIKAQLKAMGLNNVQSLPNSGKSAGIALAKTLLKECVIDKDKCADGLRVLKHYRTELKEDLNIWKEVHDWSSHGADAFRYLAHAFEIKPAIIAKKRTIDDGGRFISPW